MEGINYIPEFITSSDILFEYLKANINWDEKLFSVKTANYGKAYNYLQITYPYQEFTPLLLALVERVAGIVNFTPNNCLLNYYPNGISETKFQLEPTTILENGTGIVLISLSETQTLRLQNIADTSAIIDYPLESGSLLYISQEVLNNWQHAIIKSDTNKSSMSLTFKAIL